jgi:hypothetical protein
MKRIAVLSFIIGFLTVPIQAQAEFKISNWLRREAHAPPVLTQEAADCHLDLVKFMATAVRGVDLIDVTEEMIPNYLGEA